jgi:hypothetical protein
MAPGEFGEVVGFAANICRVREVVMTGKFAAFEKLPCGKSANLPTSAETNSCHSHHH